MFDSLVAVGFVVLIDSVVVVVDFAVELVDFLFLVPLSLVAVVFVDSVDIVVDCFDYLLIFVSLKLKFSIDRWNINGEFLEG